MKMNVLELTITGVDVDTGADILIHGWHLLYRCRGAIDKCSWFVDNPLHPLAPWCSIPPRPQPMSASDQYAQLLTTALTEPGALAFGELLERLDTQIGENEFVARTWIAAARQVQAAGHLTAGQADGLVMEIVYIWQSGLDEKAELLRSLGESALAQGTHDGKAGFWLEARKPLYELMHTLDDAERASRVSYPSWNDDDAPALPRTRGPKLYDEQYEEELEDLTDRWRTAVKGRKPWTVADALAFDYLISHDNENGAGDVRIAAIQRAHAEGMLDEDLTWLLLDRIVEAMVSSALTEDPVLSELTERKMDVEDEGGGPTDERNPDARAHASAAWLALDAAEDRRALLFKGPVLQAAGEEEMVRVMKEQPEEFRRRIARARKEWEVD